MLENHTIPLLYKSTGNVPPEIHEAIKYEREWANKYARESAAFMQENINLTYLIHYQREYIEAMEWYVEVMFAHNYAQNQDSRTANAIQLSIALEEMGRAKLKLELCGGCHG